MKFPSLFFLILLIAGVAYSHPTPDIPIQTVITDGKGTIAVEIDPRCFVEDPESEPYLMHWVLKEMSQEEKEDLTDKATDLLDKTIRFHLDPTAEFAPKFSYTFTGKDGAELKEIEDPVMITAKATISIPEEATGYSIEADIEGRLAVVIKNSLNGKTVDRVNVLFPGETSYVLDLAGSESKQGKKKAE